MDINRRESIGRKPAGKWNPEIEELLKIWRLIAMAGAEKSGNSGRFNWIIHWILQISSLIFGALSVITLILEFNTQNDPTYFLVVTALALFFGVMSTIINGITSILQLNKSAQQHKHVVEKYHTIMNNISTCLTLDADKRPDAEVIMTELKYIFNEIDREKPSIIFRKINNSKVDFDIANELLKRQRDHERRQNMTNPQNNNDGTYDGFIEVTGLTEVTEKELRKLEEGRYAGDSRIYDSNKSSSITNIENEDNTIELRNLANLTEEELSILNNSGSSISSDNTIEVSSDSMDNSNKNKSNEHSNLSTYSRSSIGQSENTTISHHSNGSNNSHINSMSTMDNTSSLSYKMDRQRRKASKQLKPLLIRTNTKMDEINRIAK